MIHKTQEWFTVLYYKITVFLQWKDTNYSQRKVMAHKLKSAKVPIWSFWSFSPHRLRQCHFLQATMCDSAQSVSPPRWAHLKLWHPEFLLRLDHILPLDYPWRPELIFYGSKSPTLITLLGWWVTKALGKQRPSCQVGHSRALEITSRGKGQTFLLVKLIQYAVVLPPTR